MDSARRMQQFQWRQWLAGLAASSAMFGENLDVVWFSWEKHTLLKLELVKEAILVITGAIIGAIIADIFGRRRTLLLTSILAIPRIADFYLVTEKFRWINMLFISFGSGLTCVLVPLYISEIAGSNNRGNLMVLQLSVYSLGRLAKRIAELVGQNYNDETVRSTLVSLLAISMLFHVIILWIYPETPQYLNWTKRDLHETAGSLAFFKRTDHVKLRQDSANLFVDSDVGDKTTGWCGRIREIFRLDNRRNLGIIFSLITIRHTSGQEWNTFAMMVMTLTYEMTEVDFLPFLCFLVATLIFCVFVMWTVGLFGKKISLLFVTFGSLIAAVIGATTIAKYFWILFGVISVRYLGHLIFIAVTLAYVGKFFPVNVRAIAIAAVISCEVLTRNLLFIIEGLISGIVLYPKWYVLPQSYSNYGAYIAAFFLVLISFPKTNKVPCSEIEIEASADGECLPLEELVRD